MKKKISLWGFIIAFVYFPGFSVFSMNPSWIQEISIGTSPHYFKVTENNEIYLIKAGDNKIYVCDQKGNSLKAIPLEGTSVLGRGGDFYIDSTKRLLIVDTQTKKLFLFSPEGKEEKSLDIPLGFPSDIAINPLANEIFIPDAEKKEISTIDIEKDHFEKIRSGTLLSDEELKKKEAYSGEPMVSIPCFVSPYKITTDQKGFKYILDRALKAVFVLNDKNEFCGKIFFPEAIDAGFIPEDIAVNDTVLFISDKKNHCIWMYSVLGQLSGRMGHKGDLQGEFYTPSEIEVTESFLYVLDSGNNRIQIFSLDGKQKPLERSPFIMFAIPSTTKVFLKWAFEKKDVKSYSVYCSFDNGSFKKIAESSVTEFEVDSLNSDTEYLFRIQAVFSDGTETPYSPEIKTRTLLLPGVGPYWDVKTEEVFPDKIRFTWKGLDKSPMKQYEIFRWNDKSREFEFLAISLKETYEDSGLEPGKKYYYKLRKVYQNGDKGELSSAFALETVHGPRPVDDICAVSGLPRKIELNWFVDDERNVEEFKIYRSEQLDGDYQVIETVKGSREAYTDQNLKDHTAYYYKISAIDKYGIESNLSSAVHAITKKTPSLPALIQIKDGLCKKMKLYWNPENDTREELTYLIYRSEAKNGEFKEIAKIKKTSFLDEKLPSGKELFYYIKVRDEDGLESGPSSILSGMTKFPPQVPKHLKALSLRARRVILHWEKNPEPDIRFYHVYNSKKNTGGFKKIGTTRKSFFIDDNLGKGLKDSTTYFYKISAEDKDGLESDLSDCIDATTKYLPFPPKDTVVVLANDTLVVSWTPVQTKDIYGYAVYKNGEKISLENGNVYIDKKFEPGKKNSYQVASVDQTGLEGPLSESAVYSEKSK